MNLVHLVISQWTFKLDIPNPAAALVPVTLSRAIFFLGRITDAIADPLAAYRSDRPRSGAAGACCLFMDRFACGRRIRSGLGGFLGYPLRERGGKVAIK